MLEEEYIERKSYGKKLLLLELPGSGDHVWRGKSLNSSMKPIGICKQEVYLENAAVMENGEIVWSENGQTPVLTIAGPQGGIDGPIEIMKGIKDTGPNSIEHNIETGMCKILDFYASKKRNNPLADTDILVMIKSHSRNAVAGTQIANRAKALRVKVEAVFFEPVPGPGHTGEDLKTDISGLDESTLVYSLNPGILRPDNIFLPQEVIGAKRLILSYKDHGVAYEKGVMFENKLYKGFSLNSLQPGLYIGDFYIGGSNSSETENIIRLPRIIDVLKLMQNLDKYYEDRLLQRNRGDIIKNVINTGLTNRSYNIFDPHVNLTV
ncbi:hypothetical protein [Methanosarcina acetivorans]|uniref:hypothetical protein n=1 Tax=Methanosarcina acetivorans TaxID=2214 RepID=UPI00064F0C39|nr:hypothetical protein [Methanosarcina acetivorans]